MKNERYVITDGLRFATRLSTFVHEPMLARMFTRRSDAECFRKDIQLLVGASFKIKRLNLNTGGVR
jgi:hypothetical protein